MNSSLRSQFDPNDICHFVWVVLARLVRFEVDPYPNKNQVIETHVSLLRFANFPSFHILYTIRWVAPEDGVKPSVFKNRRRGVSKIYILTMGPCQHSFFLSHGGIQFRVGVFLPADFDEHRRTFASTDFNRQTFASTAWMLRDLKDSVLLRLLKKQVQKCISLKKKA